MRHYSVPGAITASLNSYRSLLRGVQAKDDVAVTSKDRELKVPVLFVGATQDALSRVD